MKTKYIFLFLIFGSILELCGVLFKIQHWEYASTLLTFGIVLIVFFWILPLWKAFTHPSLRDFMNK